MKQLFPRGKRIRPTDKDLVFHTALAALFPVFLLVVLLFHIRQIAGTNWQEVSLSQIIQDVNVPCRKSHWLCRPDRLLLATALCRSRTNQTIRKDEPI